MREAPGSEPVDVAVEPLVAPALEGGAAGLPLLRHARSAAAVGALLGAGDSAARAAVALRLQGTAGNAAVARLARATLARKPLVSGANVREVVVSDHRRKVLVNGRAVLDVTLPPGGRMAVRSSFEGARIPEFSVVRVLVHVSPGASAVLTESYQDTMSAAADRWIIRVELETVGDLEAHVAPGEWLQEVTSDPPPRALPGWGPENPDPTALWHETPPPGKAGGTRPKPQTVAGAPPAPARSQQVLTTLTAMRGARGDTDDLAAKLTDEDMRSLSPSERVDLMAAISAGTVVGDEDEETIDRLLETTSSEDYERVAAWMGSRSWIFKQLDDSIDGEEYKRYLTGLTKVLIGAHSEEGLVTAIENAPELAWTGPGLGWAQATYTVEWTREGRLRIHRWLGVKGMQQEAPPIEVRPDDLVVVRFVTDEPEANAKAGTFRPMPAAAFAGLVNLKFKRDVWMAVNVAFIFGGGAGVVGGATRLARLLAAIDVAVNVANLGIDLYRAQIAATPNGQRFLKVWDTLQLVLMVYGAARVVSRLPTLIRNARTFWNNARGPVLGQGSVTAVNETEQNLRKVEQALGDAEREIKLQDNPELPSGSGRAVNDHVPLQDNPQIPDGAGTHANDTEPFKHPTAQPVPVAPPAALEATGSGTPRMTNRPDLRAVASNSSGGGGGPGELHRGPQPPPGPSGPAPEPSGAGAAAPASERAPVSTPEGPPSGAFRAALSLKRKERFLNFRRRVGARDLTGAPPGPGGSTPGHARSAHGWTDDMQANLLNQPERTFSGVNENGREVDVYFRSGDVVITEAGNKTSVITAYGASSPRGGNTPVKASRWADHPSYVEITGNEIVYPDHAQWSADTWPL